MLGMDFMISMHLAAIVIAFVVSALACLVALKLFPWFRSGERKEGHFRPDQSTGSFRVDTRKGILKLRTTRASSIELPLVGGPAMLLAVLVASIVVGFLLNFNSDQWTLLIILLVSMVGFGAVGFVDDWRKVHRGEGISEIQKFVGVMIVSLAAAVALNRLVITHRLSARLAYPPYSDIPGLGHILVEAHFAWIIFFLLMTATVASATSLAVDFSDGMDGLCGGLLLSAALSFAAILLGEGGSELWPAALAVLAIAGAAAGYLPFNWPSSWKARNQGWGNRRALLIMGDSGSLALGGLLALVAVITRLEFVLLFIGGVFVLEGVSALVSARILVRFFRKFLYLERFQASRGFPHTELPLPFLATPMHHHFDLLGWDRKRLVYGTWLLGAGLGVLGVASVIGTISWERYLARFIALLVIVAVWQSGPWTRSYFIGLVSRYRAAPEEPRQLALFYGFPFRLFGRPLYSRVDTTGVSEEALRAPTEKLALWQRMSVFDARSVLGYYCYRAGVYDDAYRIWHKIPKVNLEKRPDIAEMLAEVRHAIALETDRDAVQISPAVDEAGAMPGGGEWTGRDPNSTIPAQPFVQSDDPSSSQWRLATPGGGSISPAHLEPTDELPAPEPNEATQTTAPLWNASAYSSWLATATGGPALSSQRDSVPPAIPESMQAPPTAPADDQPTIAMGPSSEPEPVAGRSNPRNDKQSKQS